MEKFFSVTYRVKEGMLEKNQNVPDGIYGAIVRQGFPIAGSNGKLDLAFHSYNLWIGKIINISYELANNEYPHISKEALINCQKKGFKKVVNPYLSNLNYQASTIYPLNEEDQVFDSLEEMIKALTNIVEINDIIYQNTYGRGYKELHLTK